MSIQTLWIGDRLTRLERLCLASFVYHHEGEVELYTYNDVLNIPDGIRIRDANEILPESHVFSYFRGSYAGFADLFRWKLLYERGGYWVDADMLCIRPFDFQAPIVFGKETDQWGKVFWSAAVGVLKFPVRDPVTAYMLERCQQPHRIDSRDKLVHRIKKLWRGHITGSVQPIAWGGSGGPKGFAYAVEKFKLNQFMQPNTVFYPIHGTLWRSAFDSTFEGDYEFFHRTRGIHLWNEMLRSNGFDKDASYLPGSLANHYERKYLGSVADENLTPDCETEAN